MKLSVYAGNGCFIVVPEFLLPPIATKRYGRLTFQGFVDVTTLSADDFEMVRHSINRYFYAVVPQTLGEHFTRLASVEPVAPLSASAGS